MSSTLPGQPANDSEQWYVGLKFSEHWACYSVGLGSDFDGIRDVPRGLEDVSKYPQLVAELRRRGWSRRDLTGLAGANLLRILENAEYFARQLEFQSPRRKPLYDIYRKRPDLPMPPFLKEQVFEGEL